MFPDAAVTDFITGLRFDLSAIAWIFIPFSLLQLLPLKWRSRPGYRSSLRILFHVPNTLCLLLNLIDVNFFSFTLKRTSADILAMIGTGEDFITLLPRFLYDYWFTVVIFALLVLLADLLYKRTEPRYFPMKHNYYFQFSLFVIGVGLIAILARGGFQLRPLGVINASQYAHAQNVPLVLNTPFTFIKSIFKDGLTEQNYFTEEELDHVFSPLHYLTAEGEFREKNVVVIIMESFSREYIGGYNDGTGYTPFLDSLMQHSTVFTRAFANGKRSIEALPAIFSGIPNLMTNPYITSPYAGNQISSIATLLEKKGYNSSFFHGGMNGTMGFDAFASMAGINRYYGKEEYGDTDDDGNWGVFDEPFFQYFSKELGTFTEPFFSAIFSLSSHHPYTIPPHLHNRFPRGHLPIHESIGYSDHALKMFFETASKTEWYKRTVFLITADHTAQGNSAYYNSMVGIYAIPLILFDPSSDRLVYNHQTTQQADISAILLDHLNYTGPLFAYGKNPMSNQGNSFCINYNNGIYQLICEEHCLQFDGNEVIGFYDLRKDRLQEHNLIGEGHEMMRKMERTIKAIIQSYNQRMIHNNLMIDG